MIIKFKDSELLVDLGSRQQKNITSTLFIPPYKKIAQTIANFLNVECKEIITAPTFTNTIDLKK